MMEPTNGHVASDFEKIWELAVAPSFREAYNKLLNDRSFYQECCVERLYVDANGKENAKYKSVLKSEYQYLRNKFKLEFYNQKTFQQVENRYFDFYKLASTLCCAILRCKPFYFDVKKATELQKKVIDAEYTALKKSETNSTDENDIIKQRKDFNLWLVDRSLVNYKAAFLAGRRMAAFQVLVDIEENKDAVYKVIEKGLAQYPEKDTQDSYIVNMVSGLAEAEARGREIDMLFLSMLYFQDGEYTKRIVLPNST